MAEIKKINGNTLCDEVARAAADEAKTAAETAQETAGEATKVADVAINNLTGIAKMAEYDGDNKQLLAKKYNTSGGTTNTVLAAPGVAQLTTITVGDKAYAVQSSAWDNVVATYSGEDGLHVLSGKFTSTFGKEVELTETVVPYSAQVQADWNESDPTSPAYIQNRIGGYKRSEAERLVEYDETTAEYIDVDVAGSGTALRYRKASDTLVDKEDWIGGKVVIGFDAGKGESEKSYDIGTGETDALSITEAKYAAGTIWLVGMTGLTCGIVAPQETNIGASTDGVSAQAAGGDDTVIPKGVWVLDLPWYGSEVMGSAVSAYHKAVYCSDGVVKIPEEYLDTTTAETAQATAETAQATAETAQATAETAQATAEETRAFKKMSQANVTISEAGTDIWYENKNSRYFYKAMDFAEPIEGGTVTYEYVGTEYNTTIVKVESDTNKSYWRDEEDHIHIFRSGGVYYSSGDYGSVYKVPEAGVYFSSKKSVTKPAVTDATIPFMVLSGVSIGTEWLTVSDGKLLLGGNPVATEYTAGDGIYIEDGVIAADMGTIANSVVERIDNAGVVLNQIYLHSPNGLEWEISVTNEGELQTICTQTPEEEPE